MTNTIDSDSVLFAVPEETDESSEEVDMDVFEDYSPIGERNPVLFDVPEEESTIEDIAPAISGAVPVRDHDPLEDKAGISLDIEREAEALQMMDDQTGQRGRAE